MYQRSLTSLKSGEFRRIAKYGKTREGRFLKLHILEDREGPKLGLTVSKRYGKAVQRNRFKRLVREAFRLNQHQLPNNIAINIRPKAKPEGLQDIQTDLKDLL